MKREIHVCDRCGKSAETEEEKAQLRLGSICLGFSVEYYAYSEPKVYPRHKEWQKQWCQACRAELGIVEEEIRKAGPDASVPSLEYMVREIVRAEIEASK